MNRQITTLTMLAVLTLPAATNFAADVRWVFEDARAGKVPGGWSVAQTGDGAKSAWKVTEDNSAKSGKQVLAQLGAYGKKGLINLCVCDESNAKDVEAAIAMKAVKGKINRGGGLIWRYKDKDNYYLAGVDHLQNKFGVYKVDNGQLTQLKSADVEANAGEWHTIRVTHKGDQIQCYLNGKMLLEVKDGTFNDFGPVGVWTKADAITSFDDFAY